jgi:predicted secreted protein
MGVTSALVLYAVIWTLTFLIALPIRVKTQGDLGEIVPGTHAGAPEVHNIRKKAWWTTVIAAVIWAIVAAIILTETITVRDLDWFGRGAPAADETDG